MGDEWTRGIVRIRIVVGALHPGLTEYATRAVRAAGADPVPLGTEPVNGDGIILGQDSQATPTEDLVRWNHRTLRLPVLLLAPDDPSVRRLLQRFPDRTMLTWLPVDPGGRVGDLDSAIDQHMKRSVAAHTLRLIAANLPHQLQRLTRVFLLTLIEERQPPTIGALFRSAGVSPRTAERLWSRAGQSGPKRFMDRTLLLFLAIESARAKTSFTRAARALHIGPTTLRRLRQRVLGGHSVRELYDDAAIAAIASMAWGGSRGTAGV